MAQRLPQHARTHRNPPDDRPLEACRRAGERTLRGEDQLVVALEANAGNKIRRRTILDVADEFKERFFALAANDVVDVGGFQGLRGQQRRMPSAKDYWKIGFHSFTAWAISTVSRIIGPVTSEMPRQSASRTSSRTRFL